jgi:excisionase family DNA binding protein
MRVAIVDEPDLEVERTVRDLTIPDAVPEPLFLTGNDIANLLRIGRSKAFAMMAKGELPVVRFGRSVRVPRHALYGWIESKTSGPDPSAGHDWWHH